VLVLPPLPVPTSGHSPCRGMWGWVPQCPAEGCSKACTSALCKTMGYSHALQRTCSCQVSQQAECGMQHAGGSASLVRWHA
jgi:hypothetical protein